MPISREKIGRLARWAAPCWALAVVVGSFLPAKSKSRLGTEPYNIHHPLDIQHRLAHFITFGITTLFFLFATERSGDEGWAAGAAFLLGCAIELGQRMTGFASVFEWWDVRDDLIAVVVVFVAFEAWRRGRRRICGR